MIVEQESDSYEISELPELNIDELFPELKNRKATAINIYRHYTKDDKNNPGREYLYEEYEIKDPFYTRFFTVNRVKSVSLGRSHFLMISESDSNLYTWGENNLAQLGHGHYDTIKYPQLIECLKGIHFKLCFAKGDQSGALSVRGKLYRWGDYAPSFEPERPDPILECPNKDILTADMGLSHVIALTTDNKVITWGINRFCCLGTPNIPDGTYRSDKQFVELSFANPTHLSASDFNSGVISNGKIYYWGKGFTQNSKSIEKPTVLYYKGTKDMDFSEVKVGRNFLVGVSNGDIYTIGNNEMLQLGKMGPDSLTSFVKVNWKGDTAFTEQPTVKKKKKISLTSRKKGSSSNLFIEKDVNVSVGPTYVIVVENGTIYFWGSFSSKSKNVSPFCISHLQSIHLSSICCGEDVIVAVAGNKSADNLQFASFDPVEVKCGTVEGFVEYLVTNPPDTFTIPFWNTYTSFSNPYQILKVLQKIAEDAKGDDDKSKMIKIIRVVDQWLKQRSYINDPFKDQKLLEMIKYWLPVLCSENSIMLKKLEKTLETEIVIPDPLPSICDRYEEMTNDIFNLDASVVAFQITLTEHHLFSMIEPFELVGQKWSKNKKKAPSVVRMIQSFNNCSQWALTVLVGTCDVKERSRKAHHLMLIQQEMIKLNNFFGATWLASCFESAIFYKLKNNDLLHVDEKLFKSIDTFYNLKNSNAKDYRMCIKECFDKNLPCVPYIGQHLTDLTYTEDGIPELLEDKINFGKKMMVSSIIEMFSTFQQIKYKGSTNQIYNYFFYANGLENKILLQHIDSYLKDSNYKFVIDKNFMQTQSFEDLLKIINHQTKEMAEPNKRVLIWRKWRNLLLQNLKNVKLHNGEVMTYRDCFNSSIAMSKTIKSCLVLFPDDPNTEKLFKEILSLSFGTNLNKEEVETVLTFIQCCSASGEQVKQERYVEFFCQFKCFDTLFKSEEFFRESEVFIQEDLSFNNLDEKVVQMNNLFSKGERISFVYSPLKSKFEKSLFKKVERYALNFVEQKSDRETTNVFLPTPNIKDELEQYLKEEVSLLQRLGVVREKITSLRQQLETKKVYFQGENVVDEGDEKDKTKLRKMKSIPNFFERIYNPFLEKTKIETKEKVYVQSQDILFKSAKKIFSFIDDQLTEMSVQKSQVYLELQMENDSQKRADLFEKQKRIVHKIKKLQSHFSILKQVFITYIMEDDFLVMEINNPLLKRSATTVMNNSPVMFRHSTSHFMSTITGGNLSPQLTPQPLRRVNTIDPNKICHTIVLIIQKIENY